MNVRAAAVLLLVSVASQPAETGPTPPTPAQESYGSEHRSIRRDVPLTNTIRRAFDARTRNLTGSPGAAYWQLQTDYDIDVVLDADTQTLTGTETITLHNNSQEDLSDLVLRLDHNIFRARVPRGFSVPAETTEGMVLTRLVINGTAVDLGVATAGRGEARRLAARGLDQTVAMVTLVDPIAARSVAIIEIEWHTKLPGGPDGRGHRMTQRWGDTLFQPTQWFPRVAKYDDLRGWDTSVYLGPAEFYNNFGRFDVRIDVPGGWLTSATGILQNPDEVLTTAARERLATVLDSDDITTIVGPGEVGPGHATVAGDRLVWHYVADMVNDFVWATAENYIWTATRADIPEKGYVPIHMLYLPHRASLFENAGPLSRHALEFYSELWAPYPFPQLTLQDGPSAGMEYPMVINSNQGAADHEVGHQWWPMMVGTNETWYGWMDEGFNTYMNILSRAHWRDTEPDLNGRGQSYGRTSGDESEPPAMWAANYGGVMYGFQTYAKTPLMLSMLGGIVGDKAVQAAISAYTHAWAFKHPSPWDFIFFMNTELGENFDWLWYYWLWTTESVDGSIADVTTAGSTTTVTVRQDGQMPSPVMLSVEFTTEGPDLVAMDNAEMVDAHTAIVTWPVDVWFAGGHTFEAQLDFGGRTIERITLDPDGRFPDGDPSDNVWPR